MGLEQFLVGVFIKIDSEFVFECSVQFLFQLFNKLGNPTIVFVVVVPVAYEYVVFVRGKN